MKLPGKALRKSAGPFVFGRQEQRSSPRQLVSLSALIVSSDFERMVACRIEDISEGGARLNAADWPLLPRQFWLIAMPSGLAYPATTVWRRFPNVGVTLNAPIDLKAPSSTEAARRLHACWVGR